MKYSYSPTTGLQATPSAGSAHRPSYPTPAPQTAPTRPNTYTSPPPPQHNGFYNHSVPQSPPVQTRPSFQQQQNQSYRPQAFSPQSPQSPQSPHGHQSRPSQSSGYTPVNYDSPYGGGIPPEQFYGSLIDYSGRPTEIYSRLCDAAFFWIDQNCDIPGLRGTGLIDPAKYAWMTSKFGGTPEACRLVQEFLPSFFETASIPVRYVNTPTGQVPAVDRRGWLHMSVFEARARPEDQHQQWNKALALWGLVDPATNKPFPTPIPRSAFPAVAVPELMARYTQWQTAAVISAQKARSDAMVQNIMNQAYAQYSHVSPTAYLGSAAAGPGGASYLNQGGGASALGGGGNGGGDHATMLDTVNTLGTLANTLIGGFAAVGGAGFS